VREPRPDPDPELVRRAQKGQKDALRALLEEVSPTVRQWAMACAGNPDDAADLTQDVLLLLVRKLRSYRGDARFLTWLFSVTRNQALEARRRILRHRTKMDRLAEEVSGDMPRSTHPSDDIDRHRLQELVATFLEELPRRQRETFQMADLQGMTSPEIARLLGVEPGTVRASLFKARRALRQKIMEQRPELVEEYLS
jgi:RNA polymerase sigma-70 factor (ECF subfamily)